MTSNDEHVPQPTDPGDETAAAEQVAGDADTQGHSMLDLELARTINHDRDREAAKLARDGARARDAKAKDGGGFFKRLGRR